MLHRDKQTQGNISSIDSIEIVEILDHSCRLLFLKKMDYLIPK